MLKGVETTIIKALIQLLLCISDKITALCRNIKDMIYYKILYIYTPSFLAGIL